MIVLPTRNSHFYLRNPEGIITPFYEVPNASKPGEVRRTTIKDARKANALPSVTNIISILDRPALNDWRVRTAIEAALTLPRLPDESVDDYANRIVTDAEQQSVDARDFGTRIHDALDARLQTMSIPATEDTSIAPYLAGAWEWIVENVTKVYRTEFYCSHRHFNYAGRVDLECDVAGLGRTVCDFKTQRIKGDKCTTYPEWGEQIAAYSNAIALPGEPISGLSVVIDSAKPSPCFTHIWTEQAEDFETFLHAFAIWQRRKNYQP